MYQPPWCLLIWISSSPIGDYPCLWSLWIRTYANVSSLNQGPNNSVQELASATSKEILQHQSLFDSFFFNPPTSWIAKDSSSERKRKHFESSAVDSWNKLGLDYIWPSSIFNEIRRSSNEVTFTAASSSLSRVDHCSRLPFIFMCFGRAQHGCKAMHLFNFSW